MTYFNNPNLSMRQHNPLFSRGAGRVVIQIPFDDSIDASNALECFFQMPTQVAAIRSAKVWVQLKSFRTYNSAAASTAATHDHTLLGFSLDSATGSGGTGATGGEAAHTHGNSGNTGNQGATHTHDASSAETQNHTHAYSTATAAGSSHTHTGPSHTHGQSGGGDLVSSPGGVIGITGNGSHTHTISLTSGIFETAASGTISLAVANDGTNYGAAVVTGQSAITGLEIKEQLRSTSTTTDRRIKITATGLMRVQVLLVLDLKVAVLA